ncbi:MAG: hypothetical protein ABW128_01980 [Rhizorhabdus sp.]
MLPAQLAAVRVPAQLVRVPLVQAQPALAQRLLAASALLVRLPVLLLRLVSRRQLRAVATAALKLRSRFLRKGRPMAAFFVSVAWIGRSTL